MLIKLRCGNMEEINKYWLNESVWKCVLCDKGMIVWYTTWKNAKKTKNCFDELGKNREEIY